MEFVNNYVNLKEVKIELSSIKNGVPVGSQMKYSWTFENHFNINAINYESQNIFEFLASFYEMNNYTRKPQKWPQAARQIKGTFHDQDTRQQGYIFCKKNA